MFNRFASLALVVALLCTLAGTSAFAATPSIPETPPKVVKTLWESVPAKKNETKPNEKLRSDMLKLVGATKAGKATAPAGFQTQPTRASNLSRTAKIAIVAGIVVVVFAVIVVHAFNNPNCKSRCVL